MMKLLKNVCILFICLLLTPIYSKAETTVLPADVVPTITNVIYPTEKLYKTDGKFDVSFNVENIVYESDLITIYLSNMYRKW